MLRYKEAENWVFYKLLHELDDKLCYHDMKHTADVIRAADRNCYLESVNDHNALLVRTAALFHDVGFCVQYLDNEPIAAELAGETLPGFGYSSQDVELVQGMIMATRIPHDPQNQMEKIMCDADLDYLGRHDFHPISDNLKTELMRYGMVSSDKEWDQIQVKFFELHRFFTQSAQKLRNPKKASHLKEIKLRLEKYD